ncbi:hypothetical protein GC194_08680 [bacterium]|nr:hypothetical protein [bacterium]
MKRVSRLFIIVMAGMLLYSLLKHSLFLLPYFADAMPRKVIRVGLVMIVLVLALLVYKRTNNNSNNGR